MSQSAAIADARSSLPHPPTTSRASWTGRLQMGPLELPIKAYPALVVPSHGPLFQIHVGCGELAFLSGRCALSTAK